MNFVVGNTYIILCQWIQNPHDKICLCVCDKRKWFFWVNSNPRFHGIGQVLLPANCHGAIYHDSYLDLSGIKTVSLQEEATARDRGQISSLMSATVALP